jgi:transposase
LNPASTHARVTVGLCSTTLSNRRTPIAVSVTVQALFAALDDPAGVTAHRPGALERVGLVVADWLQTHERLADTEARMTAILDQLQLTELVTSIPGLSAIGAAAILAETGDRNRFASAGALVKTPAPPPSACSNPAEERR